MNKLPHEVIEIIDLYIGFLPKSKKELEEAVDLYCTNKKKL